MSHVDWLLFMFSIATLCLLHCPFYAGKMMAHNSFGCAHTDCCMLHWVHANASILVLFSLLCFDLVLTYLFGKNFLSMLTMALD